MELVSLMKRQKQRKKEDVLRVKPVDVLDIHQIVGLHTAKGLPLADFKLPLSAAILNRQVVGYTSVTYTPDGVQLQTWFKDNYGNNGLKATLEAHAQQQLDALFGNNRAAYPKLEQYSKNLVTWLDRFQ